MPETCGCGCHQAMIDDGGCSVCSPHPDWKKEGEMAITTLVNRCFMCGKINNIEVDRDKLARWRAGALIQQVWPEKTDSERELMMTGIDDECWNKINKDEE